LAGSTARSACPIDHSARPQPTKPPIARARIMIAKIEAFARTKLIHPIVKGKSLQCNLWFGWDFTDRFFIIDFMKKMVYPTNNTNPKLGG
jgi:hypothetical protein